MLYRGCADVIFTLKLSVNKSRFGALCLHILDLYFYLETSKPTWPTLIYTRMYSHETTNKDCVVGSLTISSNIILLLLLAVVEHTNILSEL